jgi:hypothetical protein
MNASEKVLKPKIAILLAMSDNLPHNFPTVQRLLRNKATRLYFGKNGDWTRECAEAWHFGSVMALLTMSSRLGSVELEEVLMLDREPSPFDVVVPLPPRQPTPVMEENHGPLSSQWLDQSHWRYRTGVRG